LISSGIVLLFIITIFTSTISAGFIKNENLLSSLSNPKISGIVLRSYVIGNATNGKQIGRIALIEFSKVEFKTIRLLPPGFGYVSYENVTVLIFGLKSQISQGPFDLDTKAENNKVSSIIFN